MAKQLNVNLAFTADTSNAKAQLQDLQNQLSKLATGSSSSLGITGNIQEASRAAAELSVHLREATNIKTGTLDFTKLNSSLNQSGTTLQKYGETLMSMGPKGQKAFMSLAQAVVTSEVPIRRTNALLKEMGTTLANTARWQISSSILHGFMGAVQSAYGYAKDLNESLNNIRIVTGQSVDQMSRFADEANKAARALSTTTTEYTNASLIYYQQGLSDSEVAKRTEVTIKMANAAGQSAQIVSDQLTAVWNNFYDGSQSLEHYADVMTALGAATASSTDEIAGGLEKFAAIADTIGLSYEYAASALATITSNTRQSEEVVGTALKTIFARIQGLNLGETLDDGTTLNKYSEALQKVGISIFDQSGELKKMDTILDEMGSKWGTLNTAQQTALAQTVAGVRQYNQLISLMDNWDSGDADSMQANLATSYSADGALQEQADIYAESWEAAQDRVRAAAEGVYDSLLNDEFFIDVLNTIEKTISFVDQLIDNMGGLKGVLLTVGAILTKVFSSQMAQGITNMAYNVRMMTESGRKAIQNEKAAFIQDASSKLANMEGGSQTVNDTASKAYTSQLEMQQKMIENAERMSETEKQTVQILMDQLKARGEAAIEQAKEVDAAKKSREEAADKLYAASAKKAIDSGVKFDASATAKELSYVKATAEAALDLDAALEQVKSSGEATEQNAQDIYNVFTKLQSKLDKDVIGQDSLDSVEQLLIKLRSTDAESEDFENTLKSLKGILSSINTGVIDGAADALGAGVDDVQNYSKSVERVATANEKLKQSNKEVEESTESVNQKIESCQGKQKTWADSLVSSANAITGIMSAISMLNGAIDTLKDPDTTGWQAFTTILTTLGSMIPMIIMSWNSLKEAKIKDTVVNALNTASEKLLARAKEKTAAASKKAAKAQDAENREQQEGIVTDIAQSATEKGSKTGGTTVGGAAAGGSGAGGIVGGSGTSGLTAGASQLAGSLAIMAAGIAILIGTISLVVYQMNEAERAVESAKEAARELSENYDQVKAASEEFANQTSEYENARTAIDNLTQGTQAYQDAVLSANEAAMQLLETNKNLAYTIENGQIVIDEDSLKEQNEMQRQNLEYAQAAKMAGQLEVQKAEANLKKRDMARDLKSDSDKTEQGRNAAFGAIGAGIGTGLVTGAAAGAISGAGVFSVPAAIIGGIVGAIGGAVAGIVANTSTDDENQALDALSKAYLEDETIMQKIKDGSLTAAEWDELGIKDEALRESLKMNADEVADLVQEMAANTAAVNAQNDLVAANALSDNKAVQDSEFQDQIIDIAGDAYGHAYDKAMESEWVDSWGKDGISKATGVNEEAEDVFADYLKYAGLEGQGYELTDTTGTDDNREFVYKDKDGKEHTVSLEAMQAARAAYEASNTLNDSATKLAETFNTLAKSSSEADQALLSFVSGKNFEDATKGELGRLEEQVGTIKRDENTNEFTADSLENVKSYLETSLGETLTEDVAIRYGYESADAMIQAFATKFEDADKAWDKIKIPDNFKFADDMSLGTAEALSSQIEKMNLGPLGEKAGKEYVEKLNSMLGELDTDDQQKALESLTAIDWSDWDALEQADAIMKEYGVDIDTTSKEWMEYADKMRKAAGATPDFSKLRDTLTSITAILQDLDFGSVISDEDYQKLVQYNDEWERYFMLQADGSRVFIGDSQAMQQEIRNNIIEQRMALQERKAAQEGFDKANWGHKDANGDWIKTDWGNKSGSDTGTAANLMNASGATEDMLELLGYTDEVIQDMITKATSGHADLVAEGEAALREMYQRIDAFTEEELDEMDAQYDEMMASTAANIDELRSLLVSDQISEEAYDKQLSVLANKAKTLEELQQIQASGLNGKVGLDTYEYGQALLNLASNYENCADEAEEYSKALLTGDEATIKAAQSALEAAVEIGELAEKYDLNSEQLEDYAKRLEALHKDSNLSAKDAAKLAAANMRLDRGLYNLNNNLKDYKKKLSETNKGSAEWSKTLSDLKTDLADVLNVADGSMLSDTFAEATLNSEDLKKALDGDVEALQRLQTMAADDIIASIKANIEGADNIAAFQSQWDYLKANMAEAIQSPEVDQSQLIASFNDMIAKGNMTKEQIEAALSGLHVSANVKTTYVQQDTEVPTTITQERMEISDWVDYQYPKADGTGMMTTKAPVYKKYTQTYSGEPVVVSGYVPQYSIEGTEGEGGITTAFTAAPAPTISHGSTTTGIKESGGGGGGGSSTPASTTTATKKTDVVDRYKELEDALDDVADALEDASKQADRLYGKARIDKLKQMNGMIQQEIGLLKNKLAAAKQYLDIDKQALEIAAQKAGVSFSFDDNDNITNYTQEMEKLYEELRAAQDAWNADYQNKTSEEQQEYEENTIKPIQDKIDELKEAIAAYEETRELIEDLENQIDDKFYEWQDNNYEILHYELEIEIEINDLELEYIDYYLNKITDDFYSMAEAAQYMNSQIPIMTDSLGQYENFYNEITAAYAAGEISQAAYVEGMQESYSAILDQLSALNDLDKEMMHYYEDTLDAASEELAYYTDQMEHLTSVLEHYRNIVELVNGEFDYEAIGTVLEGQAKTLKNELDVATANYQMLLTEQAAAEEAYRNAQDEAARELYAEELKAITAQVDEAHDLMLSKTEEWAEAQKAIMENAMAQAAHQMEKAFTDGMGFDALNDSLSRLNSYADEYLTKTNQIYETQTLINTAQKAIDKTTNEAAKARLKSYTEEIQQLQEKNKLSNLELDIAKAKYDVLLAEIALEEAQNAKATVRLQRDNEGNYGYVYTADQEAISQAEQDLMDAENALYNIGLEGANEYGQKLLELQQQLADQLIALEEARAAGQFATDAEYYAARDRLIAEYTDLFTAYSNQYTTALGVDAAIQEEAWVNAYDEMIKKTGDWQSKVTSYTEQCENSYEQWRDTVESESEVIDSVLNDLESEVKDVTDESTALKDEVVNKVIPAMKNQLVSVRDVTSAYAQQRAAIQQLISYYEQLTQSILAAIQAQAGLSDSMGENTTESGTDDFDTSIDYSRRMYEAWQANDMEAYEQAKKDRNTKISLTKEGDYGVSTARLDAWIKSGGGYNENGYFTDEWLKKHGYATGGYTGAWGPEGRLAWVHEKELMLNPEDTVNFLNATHLLRDIVDIIDINALRNQVSVLPYLFSNHIQGNGEELQQHVQIEAHFPGVTNHNEIEEAFNNLINTASQYANRKY